MNMSNNITEDDLTNAIIQRYKEFQLNEVIHPEAHYNYYGDRGVADLYISDGCTATLHEIKSKSAVNNTESGANSILRQFNRMRRYFFKDESWNLPYEFYEGAKHSEVSFLLDFTPSKSNFLHLAENREMYEQAVKRDVFGENEYGVNINKTVFISIRKPDEPFEPIPVFHSGYGLVARETMEKHLSRQGLDFPVDRLYNQ